MPAFGGNPPSVPGKAYTQKGQSIGHVPKTLPREASGTYRAPKPPTVSYRAPKVSNVEAAGFKEADKLGAGGKHPLFKAVHIQILKAPKAPRRKKG